MHIPFIVVILVVVVLPAIIVNWACRHFEERRILKLINEAITTGRLTVRSARYDETPQHEGLVTWTLRRSSLNGSFEGRRHKHLLHLRVEFSHSAVMISCEIHLDGRCAQWPRQIYRSSWSVPSRIVEQLDAYATERGFPSILPPGYYSALGRRCPDKSV